MVLMVNFTMKVILNQHVTPSTHAYLLSVFIHRHCNCVYYLLFGEKRANIDYIGNFVLM